MTWVGGIPFKSLGMTDELWGKLQVLAGEGGYWKRAYGFVLDASSRKLSSLSLRQRNWLTEIISSLGEELEKCS